ncbi:hypothetical protein OXPF_04390 [Oxobacter pfennigii]|uniref:Uncharacterized protein n=1 Tax=Oxobacter pfennigii TaxID=36849 RepID=A0A0P8WTI6_9CLOT|nr:hypothetical protein [Oxobacter pfennigii]KPU45959.1 hypothetical protein OXPF_04390 [Oxobacter pfennigii]
MNKSLILILDDILGKLEKTENSKMPKATLKDEIAFLKNEYSNTDISEHHKEIYDSMVKKGKELIRGGSLKDAKKLRYYLNYLHAALYDLRGNLKPLNWLVRGYLLSCALFVALSPQYLGPAVPLILLVPIYMGLKGIKRRSKTGLMYGLSAMPMALLTSVMVLKFEVMDHHRDLGGHILSRAQDIGRSFEFTQNLMIAVILLSIIMLISSIFTITIGTKHRRMFI